MSNEIDSSNTALNIAALTLFLEDIEQAESLAVDRTAMLTNTRQEQQLLNNVSAALADARWTLEEIIEGMRT